MTEAMLATEKVERAALAAVNSRIEKQKIGVYITEAKIDLVLSLCSLAAANRGSGNYQMSVSLEHFTLIKDHYEYPEQLLEAEPSAAER